MVKASTDRLTTCSKPPAPWPRPRQDIGVQKSVKVTTVLRTVTTAVETARPESRTTGVRFCNHRYRRVDSTPHPQDPVVQDTTERVRHDAHRNTAFNRTSRRDLGELPGVGVEDRQHLLVKRSRRAPDHTAVDRIDRSLRRADELVDQDRMTRPEKTPGPGILQRRQGPFSSDNMHAAQVKRRRHAFRCHPAGPANRMTPRPDGIGQVEPLPPTGKPTRIGDCENIQTIFLKIISPPRKRAFGRFFANESPKNNK